MTRLEVDAIVNAANIYLLGGGGIDGAIHAAAGRELYNECKKLNGCAIGQAKITKGYNLPAKNVIHTVGPTDGNPNLLRSCYLSCLDLALQHSIRTICFCCIATGIYGFPREPAAKIALTTTREWYHFLSRNEYMHFNKSTESGYQKNLILIA